MIERREEKIGTKEKNWGQNKKKKIKIECKNKKKGFGMNINVRSSDCIAEVKGMFLTNRWDLNEVANAEVEIHVNFFGREMPSDSQEAHVGENASFG